MAEASIPVDLLNPGQVFACVGFLEAADVLLGNAEARFDWTDSACARFVLRATRDKNPFEVVLEFLAGAKVRRSAPIGYVEPPVKKPKKTKKATSDDEEEGDSSGGDISFSECFPDRQGDRMALPIRFSRVGDAPIDVGHWADGSRRNEFKLYAGNRSAHRIALDMLYGKRKKPTTLGVDALWRGRQSELIASPFHVLTLMGGSFNFDPRGAWTAIDAGYSPNQHRHGIAASPVVEILAAWGLENARPDEFETRRVRYGVWSSLLPPILARPALAAVRVAGPIRKFRFELDLSGKNKVVTFAEEETEA